MAAMTSRENTLQAQSYKRKIKRSESSRKKGGRNKGSKLKVKFCSIKQCFELVLSIIK